MTIIFQPLDESHFPLLLKWLEAPHVKAWWPVDRSFSVGGYQDVKYTLDLVHEKYSSYVKGYKLVDGQQKPIQGFIIHNNQNPIGYIQIYNAYDFPRSKTLSDLPANLGAFDIFIGEEAALQQGLGSKAILEFLKLHGNPYSYIFADPDSNNVAAVKCYEKAGFTEIWNYDMYKQNKKLMLKEIETPPFDTSATEDGYARYLPPRTQDVKLIAGMFKSRPIKVSYGFCGMCDSNITNEWVVDNNRPLYELRHLVDIGRLRNSELEILIRNLEDRMLDNYWSIIPYASQQESSFISNKSFKSSKIWNFITKIFLIFKYVFINIRKFFLKSRIKLAKRYWFISKNRNFYNPILEATVYKYGSTWSIARYGSYFGSFESKEDAMDEIFHIWLKDKKFTEIANELENELKNIKHKILNEYKYRILDQQLEKAAQINHESNIIRNLNPKRIMIFGRPGTGKSTFATWLSEVLGLPLHHLDKHFYISNWVERDYNEFLQIQKNIVETECWIVDGNSTRSLEMRWASADLVLYFNFPKIICYLRIIKRFLNPNKAFDDRAPGCKETIRFSLLRYMWSFEERVPEDIKVLKERYPNALFKEIRCDSDMNKLRHELAGKV